MIRRFAFAALILGAVACGDDGEDKKEAATPADASTPDGAAPYVATKDKITNQGAACKTASDCTGAKPECLPNLNLFIASVTYPGGQCTAPCREDVECGGGDNICPLGPLFALGAGAGTGGMAAPMLPISPDMISKCQKKCTSDDQCRKDEGYRCTTLAVAFPTVAPILSTLAGSASGADGGAGLSAGLNQTFCFPPAAATPADASVQAEAGAADAGVDAGDAAVAP